MRQLKLLANAIFETFEDSGFSMAGAVAFSFVLSLFPFCIVLTTIAAYLGGEPLARYSVEYLFKLAPTPVAEVLAPEVMAVMGQSRFGLLTFGALISLFFATSAIESLRSALNVAYRERETRNYLVCLLQSSFFVLLSAIGLLAVAWGIVFGPVMAARLKPDWMLWLTDQSWFSLFARYSIVTLVIGVQLVAYHLWLAAGERKLIDVVPGVLISILLWIVTAQLFASWLTISDYSKFYAGLTRLMSALVFFQLTAMIVILGAELNRGIAMMRRRLSAAEAMRRGALGASGK